MLDGNFDKYRNSSFHVFPQEQNIKIIDAVTQKLMKKRTTVTSQISLGLVSETKIVSVV
jgi:hypothetical protein